MPHRKETGCIPRTLTTTMTVSKLDNIYIGGPALQIFAPPLHPSPHPHQHGPALHPGAEHLCHVIIAITAQSDKAQLLIQICKCKGIFSVKIKQTLFVVI